MKRQSRLTIAAAFDAAALALETKAPIPEPARLVPVGLRVTVPGSPWQVIPEPRALRTAAKLIRTGPAKGAALPRMPRCPVADALRLYGDEVTAAAKIRAHCVTLRGETDPKDIDRWRELAEWLETKAVLSERVKLSEEAQATAKDKRDKAERLSRGNPTPANQAARKAALLHWESAVEDTLNRHHDLATHDARKPKSLR